MSPCPEIKPGPGQVITATFAHPATNQILDVTIGEGDDAETIGVTDNHPFWSETHQAFVPAGQLSVGDELLTLQGQKKRLTAILPRPGPSERVYNLEVHGEHTYYVGHQQLLVHNSYPDMTILAELRYFTRGEELVAASKPSARNLGMLHRYHNPGRHDLNPNWGEPNVDGKSVLPSNHIDLFNRSKVIMDGSGRPVRYAIDEVGNVHRFQGSEFGDGYLFHWNGQTGGLDRFGNLVNDGFTVTKEILRLLR